MHPQRNYVHSSSALALCLFVALATTAQAALIDLTPTNGVNSSNSVSLADLVSGVITGVTVGDKVFTGFNYSELGDMPNASNVSVLGLQDPDGNFGVTFDGSFLDLPGGGASDAVIRYVVSVDAAGLQQGLRISDAHLNLNGLGVGAPDSSFTVDETFAPDSSQALHASDSTFAGGTASPSDTVFFNPPLTTLHVTKDILAIAGAGSSLPARATAIDQSFSQSVIPEPTTLTLCMIGLVGLRARRRNRTNV
jgi:hypothetical protein